MIALTLQIKCFGNISIFFCRIFVIAFKKKIKHAKNLQERNYDFFFFVRQNRGLNKQNIIICCDADVLRIRAWIKQPRLEELE